MLHVPHLPVSRSAGGKTGGFDAVPLHFIGQWTNYFWPMLVLGANKSSMLTTAAAALKGAYFTDYTIVMSGVILTTFPLILLFLFAGKQLVSGIMAGAVKG